MIARRMVEIKDSLRTQLWPIPTLGVFLAFAAGVLLPEVDAAIDEQLSDTVAGYLFGGGASAARTVLDAVASSMITVTSLTFSLTVVTLQLASSQFSPRLLRTFARDRFVHYTLAVFLGTFTYALTVLRTVRTAEEDAAEFVPQLSVTVAFILAVASVIGLVLFLAHLAREIRVENAILGVREDARKVIEQLLPAEFSSPEIRAPSGDSPGRKTRLICAGGSGFLLHVDEAAVLKLARTADALIVIDESPGNYLVEGTPIGRYWPASSDLNVDEDFAEKVAALVLVGFERTDTQDVGFGLRQLTDVATKALSPGINDPTTAIHSLGHSSALLCMLVERAPAFQVLGDEAITRVWLRRADFGVLLDIGMSAPRRYGAADPDLMARLYMLLREVAWHARSETARTSIRDHLNRLTQTAQLQDFDEHEQRRLAGLKRTVELSLHGTWSTQP